MSDNENQIWWQISTEEPITFAANLNEERLNDPALDASIRRAIREAVLSRLEEHGILERAQEVTLPNDETARFSADAIAASHVIQHSPLGPSGTTPTAKAAGQGE